MIKNSLAMCKFAAGSLALLLAGVSHAANVSLNASDAAGSSSFNTALHWNNSQAPSAANDYDTGGFFLRSPGRCRHELYLCRRLLDLRSSKHLRRQQRQLFGKIWPRRRARFGG